MGGTETAKGNAAKRAQPRSRKVEHHVMGGGGVTWIDNVGTARLVMIHF